MTKEDQLLNRSEIIPSRTDVLSMAREAGMNVVDDQYSLLPFLECFAALIASRVAAAAKAEEREACAKLVEESSLPDTYSEPALLEIANEIRASGETSSRGQA